MRAPDPDEQLRAGHIPAGLLPAGTDPRTVVIVQAPAPPRRSYLGPFLIVCAAVAGLMGLTVCVLALLEVAARTATAVSAAVPAGLGISYALRRTK